MRCLKNRRIEIVNRWEIDGGMAEVAGAQNAFAFGFDQKRVGIRAVLRCKRSNLEVPVVENSTLFDERKLLFRTELPVKCIKLLVNERCTFFIRYIHLGIRFRVAPSKQAEERIESVDVIGMGMSDKDRLNTIRMDTSVCKFHADITAGIDKIITTADFKKNRRTLLMGFGNTMS